MCRVTICVCFLLCSLYVSKCGALGFQALELSPNATVALDGSGSYKSISAAIAAAPEASPNHYVIYIKRGIYHEYIDIPNKKWNIVLIGDGVDATVISGGRSNSSGIKTLTSATFGVSGQGFVARDITFENMAGPQNGQAVAFRSDSDKSVLFRCSIKGYQDTLYAHSQRQFYRECAIMGTVDFIFGQASAVFQNCTILARKGLTGQKNTVTAQGREAASDVSAFSFQFCTISAEAGVATSTETYLGRPWRLYSRTVVMQSFLTEAINPRGWLEWNGSYALDTLFYGEYKNNGPGAAVDRRVTWPGFQVIIDPAVANAYTVSQLIHGNDWLPRTGVNYSAGLLP